MFDLQPKLKGNAGPFWWHLIQFVILSLRTLYSASIEVFQYPEWEFELPQSPQVEEALTFLHQGVYVTGPGEVQSDRGI